MLLQDLGAGLQLASFPGPKRRRRQEKILQRCCGALGTRLAYNIPTHMYLNCALSSAKIVVDNSQVPTRKVVYPQNALHNVPPKIDITFS